VLLRQPRERLIPHIARAVAEFEEFEACAILLRAAVARTHVLSSDRADVLVHPLLETLDVRAEVHCCRRIHWRLVHLLTAGAQATSLVLRLADLLVPGGGCARVDELGQERLREPLELLVSVKAGLVAELEELQAITILLRAAVALEHVLGSDRADVLVQPALESFVLAENDLCRHIHGSALLAAAAALLLWSCGLLLLLWSWRLFRWSLFLHWRLFLRSLFLRSTPTLSTLGAFDDGVIC